MSKIDELSDLWDSMNEEERRRFAKKIRGYVDPLSQRMGPNHLDPDDPRNEMSPEVREFLREENKKKRQGS